MAGGARHLATCGFVLLAVAMAAGTSRAATRADDADAADESTPLIVFDLQSPEGKRVWLVRNDLPHPRFPHTPLLEGVSACVFVAFIVQPDGSTSGARLLKRKTNVGGSARGKEAIRAYARAVAESLKRLSFEPGPDNPGREPGFTGYAVAFSAPGSKFTSDECSIPDLATYLSGNLEPARPDLPEEPQTAIEPEKTGD